MSLADAQIKLESAIEKNDLAEIAKWGPIHRRKLAWVTDQVQADRQAELTKANKPIVDQRQARRDALLSELNALTQNNVSSNFDRIREIDQELGDLR
jgi:hypothetical protein